MHLTNYTVAAKNAGFFFFFFKNNAFVKLCAGIRDFFLSKDGDHFIMLGVQSVQVVQIHYDVC